MKNKTLPLRGTYGEGGIGHAREIKESGCNALWFHGFREEGFNACEKHDLGAGVEFRTFRGDYDAHPELIPIGVDGSPIRWGTHLQGVCLSQTDFIQQRFEELKEGMSAYRPMGVWLDYLTYGGWFESADPDLQESCFCPDCIENFCQSTGIDCDSPQEILQHHKQAWTDHKCRQVAGYGAEFASVIKKSDPECLVGAYMCPWTPEEYEGALSRIFAQDYSLFAGFTDIFTPLMYAEKSGRPHQWSRNFLEDSHRFVPKDKPVLPILDALDFPGSLEALVGLKENTYGGFQIFSGGDLFEDEEKKNKFYSLMKKIMV
jgi:hypothetical protein